MIPKATSRSCQHSDEHLKVVLLQSIGYTYVPAEGFRRERASFRTKPITGGLAAARQ